ncbi:MAG: DUF2523 domain-containing protein [Oceanococcus sp.]|nr:MAG: DUF2523 domain-containing protein [Oceanococcus sp.]
MIGDFFNFVKSFFLEKIPGFAAHLFEQAADWFLMYTIKTTTWFLNFSWEIFTGIAAEIDISAQLDLAMTYLPAESVGLIYALGLPQMVNMVISAWLTVISMRILPG